MHPLIPRAHGGVLPDTPCEPGFTAETQRSHREIFLPVSLRPLRFCVENPILDENALYCNLARMFFASSAPENFGSNSRAFLSSFFASSLSPFL